MNVYEKLQMARCELQKKEMKKSGKNTFSKYDYFELSDFLPEINNIMDAIKLSSTVHIDDKTAVLTIINSEKETDYIDFKIPVSIPEMKGANSIQTIGAMITYVRRYLYMLAFEIVEHDIIDQLPLETEKQKTVKPEQVNNNAKAEKSKELRELARPIASKLDAHLKQRLSELAKDNGSSLTPDEYSAMKTEIKLIIAENNLDKAVQND